MRLIDVSELINNINEFAECVKAGSEFTRGYVAAHKNFAKFLAEQPTIEQLRWIPVTERLPTEEDANEYDSVIAIAKDDGFARSWLWDVVERYHTEFTHWMPLPQPPKGDE